MDHKNTRLEGAAQPSSRVPCIPRQMIFQNGPHTCLFQPLLHTAAPTQSVIRATLSQDNASQLDTQIRGNQHLPNTVEKLTLSTYPKTKQISDRIRNRRYKFLEKGW